MIEEGITNPSDTTPPYISYYTLGGKLVGLRRGNHPSENGQYRVVGDHLGSTSLLVNTSSTPVVVQRTYHKPYGEVAYSWSSTGGGSTYLTSVGYTGQRLEAESGLMHYGARFYDPALSFFVSADTIAPDPVDPHTRNRYSYVLNNPLGSVDPTGHTAQDANEDQRCNDNNAECNKARIDLLTKYGIEVSFTDIDAQWTLAELYLALEAIGDMLRTFKWSEKDFRDALGTSASNPIFLQKSTAASSNNDGIGAFDAIGVANQGSKVGATRSITLYGDAFESRVSAKSTLVHELAHAWDHAETLRQGGTWSQGGGQGGVLAAQMRQRTGGGKGAASNYGERGGPGEDWAEAVAATVYEESYYRYREGYDFPQYGYTSRRRMDMTRRLYVYEQAFPWSTAVCAHFGGCRR